MQKPNTVGFTLPPDFPLEGYNSVHSYLNKYKDTHRIEWGSFGEGWNGLAYRYRAMAEYDEQFTTYVRKFGNSPPPEERYQQGKALFGFFTNAVSVIESFFYSNYYIASILKPDAFPLPKSEYSVPAGVASKFTKHFTSDKLTEQMNKCLDADNCRRMRKMRNVLSHRGMPPRKFYQGGERHGMATMPINPEAQSDQWQFDFSVDEQTTKMFREWLSNTLADLMDSADKFCASKL